MEWRIYENIKILKKSHLPCWWYFWLYSGY